MGVYIKGMQMPNCCRECQFMDFSGSEGNRCELTLEFTGDIDFDSERREEHCPLIELPPHGRLIDADALCAKADDTIVHNDPVNLVVEIGMAFKYYLKNAPTVIEAEG